MFILPLRISSTCAIWHPIHPIDAPYSFDIARVFMAGNHVMNQTDGLWNDI